jgi:hypothetical protein
VNVNVVRIFQFWRVFFISLSLSLFIGSRCGYSLDPARFERKPNSRTRLLHYVCVLWVLFCGVCTHYIFIEIESLLLLSSLQTWWPSGRLASVPLFFSSSFLFFSPSFHILFFSRHLNLDVVALVSYSTRRPKPYFLVRLSLASRRCIQKAARRGDVYGERERKSLAVSLLVDIARL